MTTRSSVIQTGFLACLRRVSPIALLLATILVYGGITPARADQFKIGGTGSSLAGIRLIADAYVEAHPGTKITVLPSLGSGGGIKAVLAGAIQVAISGRPLKETESQAGAVAVEYARTPFVFATHTNTAATGLNEQELVDILSGETDRWPDGTKIRLVLRPVGDSASNMIKDISPAVREVMSETEQRKGMPFAVTDQDAADSIEKIPGALGASTLGQILTERRQLKALKWNGIEPDATALADGSYPFYKQLFVVNSAKTSPAARDFVVFLQSAAAQEILVAHGHWVP